MKPETYSTERACHLERWETNRDHIGGAYAIKAAGEKYLSRAGVEDAHYETLKARTTYYPAAAHTHAAFVGLVTRKPANKVWPTAFDTLAQAFTYDGETLDDHAEKVFSEALINCEGGLLADKDAIPQGLNKAEEEAGDFKAYGAFYKAEDILDLKYGRIGGKRGLIGVMLADADGRRRELGLVNGVYTVTMWKLKGVWAIDEIYTPQRKGKPITFIPFVPMAGKRALMDDVVALNQNHYIAASDLAMALYWYRSPMIVVKGVPIDFTFEVGAGKALNLGDNQDGNSSAEYLAYNNELGPLERNMSGLEDKMSKIGARMLASEKADAEAEGTLARRQAGEQSILAGLARFVSRKVAQHVRHVAWLEGITEDHNDPAFDYQLNTDFMPQPMDKAEIEARVLLIQNGLISKELAFECLKSGEIIPEAADFETEQARLEATVIDQPIGE